MLDDAMIDAILGLAVNTRNAEMRKGDDRSGAKVGLACALQDACLVYINRVETERQLERLKEAVERLNDEVSRLRKEFRGKEALLDVMRTREVALRTSKTGSQASSERVREGSQTYQAKSE